MTQIHEHLSAYMYIAQCVYVRIRVLDVGSLSLSVCSMHVDSCVSVYKNRSVYV
jgi:hypothetical protein